MKNVCKYNPNVFKLNFTLFSHFRVYFLGGEKVNKGHWYDVEADNWGQLEDLPPPRLLAATAALHDRVFLVGKYLFFNHLFVYKVRGRLCSKPELQSH